MSENINAFIGGYETGGTIIDISKYVKTKSNPYVALGDPQRSD